MVMDPQLIIEKYQNAIIQIATATGTGTGFYIKEFDLIVTNDHVVAENAEVTIAGNSGEYLWLVVANPNHVKLARMSAITASRCRISFTVSSRTGRKV